MTKPSPGGETLFDQLSGMGFVAGSHVPNLDIRPLVVEEVVALVFLD